MRRRRLASILLPLGLLVAMVVIGVLAIKSSSYKSVCEIVSMRSKAEVIVKGELEKMVSGILIVHTPGAHSESIYRLEIVTGGYGAKAESKNGKVTYLVFVLGSDECPGKCLVALYNLEAQPAIQVKSHEVVFKGIFDPNVVAEIRDSRGHVIYRGPVLMVTAVLEGCHKSYEQPIASER